MTFTQPFSDYEILARVGSGAMGTVFKARQKKLDRIVALKVLKPALARDARYVERLVREARIVGALNHPNIVAGFDLGEEGGYHYFVMEFVDGRSLKDLLREWGSFPETQVLDVAIQVTLALEHAWQKGVIHRDVKPGNILIDQKGHVKLTDMGLAKGPEDQTLTREGATVGTPQYLSPEQARDPQTADIRSDLYSLGATLFHMETGQPPFSATTTGQMIVKLLHERAPSAAALNPAISQGLSLVTRKLLAKEPGLRYQTPTELLLDLGRVQRQEAPAVDVRSLEAESPRRSTATRVGLLVAGLVVASLVGLWFATRKSEESAPPVDPRAALVARLEKQLSQEKGKLAGWRVLKRAEDAESRPLLKEHVRSMRDGLEASWRFEIDALLEEQMRGATAWLAEAAHWREPERFFVAVVEPGLKERFGALPAELPLTVRKHYDEHVRQRRAELEALVEQRAAEYLERFKRHVEEDTRDALEPLLAGRATADFRAAAAALHEAIAYWHGQEGRPARRELPPALAEQCAQLESKALEAGTRRIDDEERRAADDLRKELDERVPKLRGLIDQDNPVLVKKALRDLEQDLHQNHPGSSAFRVAIDPWTDVERRLRDLKSDIDTALAQAEAQRLDGGLVACYAALLAAGEAKKELVWLEHLELTDRAAQQLRERHAALIADAQLAFTRVLDAVAEGRTNPVISSSKIAGGLRLERRNERFVPIRVVPGKGDADSLQLAAHELPWSEWLDKERKLLASTDPEARRRLARGIAVWLEVGRSGQGLELVLEKEDRLFLANVLPEVVRAAVEFLAREDRPDAREALAGVRALYAERDLEKIRKALTEFDDRYGASAAAASARTELREIRTWIRREQKRALVRSELERSLPKGCKLSFEDDGAVRIGLSPEALAALPGVDEAFLLADNELVARPPGATEPAFVLRRLLLPADLAGCELRSAVVTLRFPEAGPTPRVAIAGCAGIALVAEALRSNAIAQALVPCSALDRSDSVRQALQKPLESALLLPKAHVVPGARHELGLQVQPPVQRGMPTSARAFFDGALVRSDTNLARSSVLERPELRCVPGTALCHVELLGSW